MNEKKIFSNVQEKIALDNFKKERIRYKKRKKGILIVATAATAIAVSLIAVKVAANKD